MAARRIGKSFSGGKSQKEGRLSRLKQIKRPPQPGEPRPLIFVAEVDPRSLQYVAGARPGCVLELPDPKKPRVLAGGRRKAIIWVAMGNRIRIKP